ncbi:MAG TPA: DMT family transporter [Nocardioidaceae bacterium]|nr:DMT family transporter [Nocardioidaceae bacterium]
MRTLLLMAVGVVAVSTSAPLIAVMTVPPLAISFWRNGFATVAMTPVALTGRRRELAGLGRRQVALVVASGLALAVHFGTWVTSVKLTSVAASTALVCLQIGWVVAWQVLRGRRIGAGMAVGLVVAFAGVLVVSGVDVAVSRQALVGDLLALAGGIAAAAYMLIGSRARQTMTTTAYTWVCYGSCAVALAVACVVAGQPLGGYPLGQWGLLLLTTATAQLLGHSVFNHLLATTRPVLVSLALLLEVPGASLIAAFFLGQRPPVGTLVGLAVILAGMALVVVNNHAPALRQPPVD